jgi:predicted nucleotidyltransferase
VSTTPLIARVAAVLDQCGVRYALIGAGALAAHGIARSTFDLDLFTDAVAVLQLDTWAALSATGGVHVSVRTGDADDPLRGVVRIEADGERDVDVVVGRSAWQSEAVDRAQPLLIAGIRLRVVAPADLVLFKLYAGGSQDCWDIEQLLAVDDREPLIQEVESRLAALPGQARQLWRRLIHGA